MTGPHPLDNPVGSSLAGAHARFARRSGARGEIPFLHALTSNTGAIGLYEALGFRLRRTIVFSAVRVPGTEPAARGHR